MVVTERYGLTEKQKGGKRAQPGVNVFIVGENNTVLPPGSEGEICVAGPNVMRGYHNNPQATAEVMTTINGLRVFRTGDLGVLDERGTFVLAF